MQLKFIDWRAEYEGEQDHPAHLYHIQSRRGALDSWKERSRLKTLKAFAAHAGKNIHASKRYFSAPGYSLASPESAPAGLRPALAVLARLHASPEALLLDYAPLEEALELPADALHRPDLYYLDLSEGEAALYYYCAPTAELQFVRSAEAGQAVRWFPAAPPQGAEGLFLCTANLLRCQKLFGDRGYRIALLEAGCLSGRLAGCAEASGGLAVKPTAAFYDKEVNGLLGMDGVFEACLMVDWLVKTE